MAIPYFEPVDALPSHLTRQRPVLLRYVPMFALTREQSRYLSEGLGTFLFVTIVSLSEMNSGTVSIDGKERTRNLAPVGVGFGLAVVILCFGYISDGHFNPALTLAATLAKGIHMEQAISYWTAQVIGGIAGGALGMLLNGTTRHLPAPQIYRNEAGYIFTAFASEAIYTAVLASVMLHVVYSPQRNMELYAMAMGFGVMSAQYAVGTLSGGSFNPAIATGLQLTKLVAAGYVAPIMQLWLYWAAPAVGAVAASLIFQMTHPAPPPDENLWADAVEPAMVGGDLYEMR